MRTSVDVPQPDGTVRKTTVHEHKGWVEAANGDPDKGAAVRESDGSAHGIINLTQHEAKPAQIAEGLVEPKNKAEVIQLLTFNEIPTQDEIEACASAHADIAAEGGFSEAMIAGAPYFDGPFERALENRGIRPMYSYSANLPVIKQNPDGTTVKELKYQHAGFVVPPSHADAMDKKADNVDNDEKGVDNDEKGVDAEDDDDDFGGFDAGVD